MTNIVTYGDGSTEDLDRRYEAAVDVWQMANGCTTLDMTPEQLERYSAWQVDCDLSLARWLVNQRRGYVTVDGGRR